MINEDKIREVWASDPEQEVKSENKVFTLIIDEVKIINHISNKRKIQPIFQNMNLKISNSIFLTINFSS